jgi:hypothetical protein
MNHLAKVVHIKHEADGILSVLMRCCEDTSTDQWHTFYVKPETSDQEVQEFHAYAKSRCEQQHGARMRACAIIEQGF